MPFEIVRNDIVNMHTDAIVNTANPKPVIGSGVDAGIHKKAGKKLLEKRKEIGDIGVGEAIITPGYDLYAKYVIHTSGPVWMGGDRDEEKLLRKCYENSLRLALENGCESIAFPLISSGNYGFPKHLALEIAMNTFSGFLMKHEMQIYLVVFDKDSFSLSEKLFCSVKSYIDEKYVDGRTFDEYKTADTRNIFASEASPFLRVQNRKISLPDEELPEEICPSCVSMGADTGYDGLEDLLEMTDAGFSETLLRLIDKTGRKDSDIYKKANIDRKLFSKIRNNPDYRPSKSTALAFAIALELNLDETKDFIQRAGYALSHSSKFDIIIEYFITHKNYDMFEINETLFAFDQNLLGA